MKINARFWFIPIIVLSLFVFQQIASRFGSIASGLFSYDRIDPYNIFMWISVHHIVQGIIALVAVGILIKVKNLDFGFRLGNVRVGLEHTLDFTIIVLIYVVVFYIITFAFGNFSAPNFPLNITNVAGTLGFQLLLSGPVEEILFRALPITLLIYSFKASKPVKIYKVATTSETIIAAVLFTLAHVRWEINPFSIDFSVHQLVICLFCGILYGIAYQKSNSVLYPMAMHSIWNVVIVGTRYILAVLLA